MGADFLPRQDVSLIDSNNRTTTPFYVWLQSIERKLLSAGVTQAEFDALVVRVQALEDEGATDAQVYGILSVYSAGTLADGSVAFSLLGDQQDPGNTYYYGTGPDGTKGFYTVASAFTATQDGIELVTGLDGVSDIRPDDDLEAIEALATTGLAARTEANTWALREIEPVAGETIVADGDAVAGNPVIGLADVPDGGGGTLQKTAFDAKGRKTDTSAATTDDLPEGVTNLYYDEALVDARVAVGIAAFQAAPSLDPLTDAIDDAAAAIAGVAIGELYRNGSILMIRVT